MKTKTKTKNKSKRKSHCITEMMKLLSITHYTMQAETKIYK